MLSNPLMATGDRVSGFQMIKPQEMRLQTIMHVEFCCHLSAQSGYFDQHRKFVCCAAVKGQATVRFSGCRTDATGGAAVREAPNSSLQYERKAHARRCHVCGRMSETSIWSAVQGLSNCSGKSVSNKRRSRGICRAYSRPLLVASMRSLIEKRHPASTARAS